MFSSNKQDTSEKLDTIFYKHENTRRLEEVIFFVTLCSAQARKKNQKCFCVHFIILHRRTFLECHSFWQNEEEIAIYPSCSFALFLKSILILIDAVTSTKKWGELIFLLHLLIQFSRQQKESTWLLICWFLVLHPYSISQDVKGCGRITYLIISNAAYQSGMVVLLALSHKLRCEMSNCQIQRGRRGLSKIHKKACRI